MPRQGDQEGMKALQECRSEHSSLNQSSTEGSGENDWVLGDLLTCDTFSAYSFTVSFEYLFHHGIQEASV